jgi:predicted dehydrogenase
MDSIRVGFIGFGAWTQKAYVPALKENDKVELIAVAARSEESHSIARTMLGDSIKSYTDYKKLLGDPNIDAVMIGTPPDLSSSATLSAIKAGKHTFIEPPLDDSSSTRNLFKLVYKSGKVFHVDTEIRYLPIIKSIRNITLNADFGSINKVTINLENNWANEWKLDKSGLHDMVAGLSPWYIDPIDFMFRRTPDNIHVVGADNQVGQVKLEYSGNCEGLWNFNLHGNNELSLNLSIHGTNGLILADLISGNYSWTIGSDSGSANSQCQEPILGFVGMRESVNVFLETILGNTMTLSGPEVYTRIHKLVQGLKASQSLSGPVKIKQ